MFANADVSPRLNHLLTHRYFLNVNLPNLRALFVMFLSCFPVFFFFLKPTWNFAVFVSLEASRMRNAAALKFHVRQDWEKHKMAAMDGA